MIYPAQKDREEKEILFCEFIILPFWIPNTTVSPLQLLNEDSMI